jgi:hypothetical protein
MPSQADVIAFTGTVADLSDLAVGDLTTVWQSVAGPDAATVQAAMEAATPAVLEPYTAASAELATQWYGELADTSYVPTPAPPPPADQIRTSVRWAMGPLFGRGQAEAVNLLAGAAQRYVLGGARDTLTFNATREGVRFARHASATACPFCRMLAAQGAVYHSKATAKGLHGFHDHDHCMPVPVRPGDHYTPPDYVAGWKGEYDRARRVAGTDTLYDVLKVMRRETGPRTAGKALTPAQAVASTNPGLRRSPAGSDLEKAYTTNCQRCVNAYELRRRGFPVCAGPAQAGWKSMRMTDLENCWNVPYGGHPVFTAPNQPITTTAELARHIGSKYPPNSRGVLHITWRDKLVSHVINWEVDGDGKVGFYDGQSGGSGTPMMDRYMKGVLAINTNRLDNCEPDWKMFDLFEVTQPQ